VIVFASAHGAVHVPAVSLATLLGSQDPGLGSQDPGLGSQDPRLDSQDPRLDSQGPGLDSPPRNTAKTNPFKNVFESLTLFEDIPQEGSEQQEGAAALQILPIPTATSQSPPKPSLILARSAHGALPGSAEAPEETAGPQTPSPAAPAQSAPLPGLPLPDGPHSNSYLKKAPADALQILPIPTTPSQSLPKPSLILARSAHGALPGSAEAPEEDAEAQTPSAAAPSQSAPLPGLSLPVGRLDVASAAPGAQVRDAPSGKGGEARTTVATAVQQTVLRLVTQSSARPSTSEPAGAPVSVPLQPIKPESLPEVPTPQEPVREKARAKQTEQPETPLRAASVTVRAPEVAAQGKPFGSASAPEFAAPTLQHAAAGEHRAFIAQGLYESSVAARTSTDLPSGQTPLSPIRNSSPLSESSPMSSSSDAAAPATLPNPVQPPSPPPPAPPSAPLSNAGSAPPSSDVSSSAEGKSEPIATAAAALTSPSPSLPPMPTAHELLEASETPGSSSDLPQQTLSAIPASKVPLVPQTANFAFALRMLGVESSPSQSPLIPSETPVNTPPASVTQQKDAVTQPETSDSRQPAPDQSPTPSDSPQDAQPTAPQTLRPEATPQITAFSSHWTDAAVWQAPEIAMVPSAPEPTAAARASLPPTVQESHLLAPEIPKTPGSSEILLHLTDNDQSYAAIRVADRAGSVNVSVHASDPVLRESLRSNLGDLSNQLNDQGWRADLIKSTAAPTQSGSQPDSHGGEQRGSQQQQSFGGDRQPQRDRRASGGQWQQELDREISGDAAHSGGNK